MRVAYVQVVEGGRSETLGPQPRADAELDWEWALSELPREGKRLTRLEMHRVGDTLRRAEFMGPRGLIEVLLVDDGSW